MLESLLHETQRVSTPSSAQRRHSAPTSGPGAPHTVAVIAYGSRYDVPVTANTRVLSVLREIAELTISASDAEALGDVDAALFHDQVPLAPDTAMRALPVDSVLHFHTSLDTVVARGKANHFIKVTDLMRGSGAGMSLQSYHGKQRGSSFSYSRGTSQGGYTDSLAGADARFDALQQQQQQRAAAGDSFRPAVSYPFTPSGSNAGLQASAPAAPYLPSHRPNMLVVAAPRGCFTSALPGNPWGLEERGPTYRVPIQASQDYLLENVMQPVRQTSDAEGSDKREPLLQPGTTTTRSVKRKSRTVLAPLAVNTHADGADAGQGTARKRSQSPLSAVKQKFHALPFGKRGSKSKASSRRGSPSTAAPLDVDGQTTTAPGQTQPLLSGAESKSKRKGRSLSRSLSRSRSRSSSTSKRNGYYEASSVPAASTAATPSSVPLTSEEKVKPTHEEVQDITEEAPDSVRAKEDAQYRVIWFDSRGLGPYAPAPTATEEAESCSIRHLRVQRVAAVSALRERFSIDPAKRLYIGGNMITDEATTLEATVVFLGSREGPVCFTFAEPNMTPRLRSSMGSMRGVAGKGGAATEDALRVSQEMYRERVSQRGSPAGSFSGAVQAATSPRSSNVVCDPPPLPLPSGNTHHRSPTAAASAAPKNKGRGSGSARARGGSARERHSRRTQHGTRRPSLEAVEEVQAAPPHKNTKGSRSTESPHPRQPSPPLSATERSPATPSLANAPVDAAAKPRSRSPMDKVRQLGTKLRRPSGQAISAEGANAVVHTTTASGGVLSATECSAPSSRSPSGSSPAPLDTTATGGDTAAAKDTRRRRHRAERGDSHSRVPSLSAEEIGAPSTTGMALASPTTSAGSRPDSILQTTSTIRQSSGRPSPSPSPSHGGKPRPRSVSVDSPGNSLIHPNSETSLLSVQEQEGQGYSVPPPMDAAGDAAGTNSGSSSRRRHKKHRSSRSRSTSGERQAHASGREAPESHAAAEGTTGDDTGVVEANVPEVYGDFRIIVRDPRDHDRFHYNIPVEGGCPAFIIRDWMTECLGEIAQERAQEKGGGQVSVEDYTDAAVYELYCGNTLIDNPATTFAEATQGKNDCIFSLFKKEGSA